MTPDSKSYETMYLRWLMLQRASKGLAHKDHEPKPADFGLSDKEAAFIRVRLEREFYRS